MKQNIEVPSLARVEGEGALYIRLKDGKIDDIEVNIYEPPRFFEGFLQGRYFQEVPDITARICGICPVAYQMSSVQALEKAMDVVISPEIKNLRRLLYCAEYIESHALHIYMLQAPDLLGVESALTLAETAPDVVKTALRLKQIGNNLLKAIGGRSIHPVNACVGGFYRWPDVDIIKGLLEDMKWALEVSQETVRWSSTLEYPEFEQDYEFVTLSRDDHYAIYDGEIKSSKGMVIPGNEFESIYLESHVSHSNALHSHNKDGNPYFVGPLARLNVNYDQLRPIAKQAADDIKLPKPLLNPYKGLIARAIELVEVCDVALEIMEEYDPKGPSKVEFEVKAGEGIGTSEAPRGLLYHRYVVDENGMIRYARITPPTAQNFAQMEADLWKLAPAVLELSHDQATLACEHLLRSYDPCISCATHFLKLEITEE